jgi:flagellar biosynthesis/type III secretory pathway ATPase
VATAWRELALAAGEPPAYRGYPPSLVGMLADLVERGGARVRGSITGIYVVLVDGDDPFEPVTDAIRALLDGHIALSRRLADAAKYPAIDVLRSLSRTMPAVATEKHLRDAATVRGALATLEQAEDLLAIGAYREGADPWLDACLAARFKIEALIFHGAQPVCDPIARLADIAEQLQLAKGEWS